MARDFDGTLDFIRVSDVSRLDLTDGVTIMAWYYPEAAGTSDGANITGKNRPFNGLVYGLSHYTGDDKLHFRVETSSLGQVNANDIFTTLNKWYHVCGSWKTGTNNMHLYADGVEVAQGTKNGTLENSSEHFTIGGIDTSSTRRIDGRAAEVAVYNRKLTEAEINSAMRRVMNVRDGLILYMPCFGKDAPEPEYTFGGGYTVTHISAPPQADHAPVAPPFGISIPWTPISPAAGGLTATAGIAVWDWTATKAVPFTAIPAIMDWAATKAVPFTAIPPTWKWSSLKASPFKAIPPTWVWKGLGAQVSLQATAGIASFSWLATKAVGFRTVVPTWKWTSPVASPFTAGLPVWKWLSLTANKVEAGLPQIDWTALVARAYETVPPPITWTALPAVPFKAKPATVVWEALNATAKVSPTAGIAKWVWKALPVSSQLAEGVISKVVWTALNAKVHPTAKLATIKWTALNATAKNGVLAGMPVIKWIALNANPVELATVTNPPKISWVALNATADIAAIPKPVISTSFEVDQNVQTGFEVDQTIQTGFEV